MELGFLGMASSPVLIGNITNMIVPHETGKSNGQIPISPYFSTGFWFLDCLPRARLKVMKSLNY